METSLEIDLASFPTEDPGRQYAFIRVLKDMVAEKRKLLGRDLTMHVETFGCQMNARDSEKLLGILKAIGYRETEHEERADLVLMNTCTVRDNADQRVYGRLGVLKGYKKNNPNMHHTAA